MRGRDGMQPEGRFKQPGRTNGRTSPSGAFGVYLRQLRQSCGQRIGGLAARSGVSERSLRRWENGAARPRLPELERVLRALAASPAEQARARELVRAARGIHRQGHTAIDAALLGHDMILPGAGALLRTLRHRRGYTLSETAVRLGLQPSSICRWERSETVPAGNHLEALLHCLGARPHERAALRGALAGVGPLAASSPDEEPVTLAALRREFIRLSGYEMWQAPGELIDLWFISLEVRLRTPAIDGTAARALLARTYAYHAFWLSNAGRLGEAAFLSRHCRRLCEPDGPECRAYVLATIISARWDASGGIRSRARARRTLGSPLPWERYPDLHAWATSELGHCLIPDGDAEAQGPPATGAQP